jgi:hypothetical protein
MYFRDKGAAQSVEAKARLNALGGGGRIRAAQMLGRLDKAPLPFEGR